MGIFSMAVCMGACSHNYEELSNGEEEIPGVEPHEVMFSVKILRETNSHGPIWR